MYEKEKRASERVLRQGRDWVRRSYEYLLDCLGTGGNATTRDVLPAEGKVSAL